VAFFSNINFKKLKSGLTKTRNKIVNSIQETITGKAVIDEQTIDDIEEILITSDIGFVTTGKIIDRVRATLKNVNDRTHSNIIETVKQELLSVFDNEDRIDKGFNKADYTKPYVILIIGVNGVGKTTTIGKLAYILRSNGAKVIVGAADTFRAAAGEQLDIWALRAGVDIVQKESGSDPSSVAYDTVQKAVNEKYDFVIIDTAGRLHNKLNLMKELDKIKRAVSKVLPDAPHDTFLILDGTVGQNAIVQAEEFSKVTNITGLIITKLDGTAKGGVIFQIYGTQHIPIRFIGVGESIGDLQTFDSKEFINAIFEN
jgi:fused signal recognition particle receptor